MKIRLAVTFASLTVLASFCAAGSAAKENCLNIIRAGLNDPSKDVCELSARALGEIGDKASLKAIKEMLSNQSDTIKISAAVALSKLGDRSGVAEIRKILRNAPVLSENPKPMERVRAIARGTVRAQAARELGNLKDTESIALLKTMSKDEDGRVADASFVALAKMGDNSGIKQFISALESTKQEVRAKAAEALSEVGDQSAVEALRKRLKDWDKSARSSAAVALGKLKDKISIPVLKEMLFDKDDIVREKTAEALGYMGAADIAPALKELLKDKNGFVRFAAVEALYRLGQDTGRQFVIDALKAQEKDAKLKALNILDKIATVKDIKEIEPLVSDADKTVSITAAKVILITEAREKHN